jgi:hypothetical protein
MKDIKIGKIRTRLKEAQASFGLGSKFQVVLIQEGLGNLKDCFFYTKQALESSPSLFEGKKCFVDHPTTIEENTRPERSTRDILGHFENVKYQEGSDGRGMLVADLVTLTDPSFGWAQSVLKNSLEYSNKFPDSEFVGLSINASGEANEVSLQEFMSSQANIPPSVMPKIQKAQEEGIDQIRVVNQLKDAVSVDLVTEAGAGGKILQMIEMEKRPMKKEMEKCEKKEMEKKEMEKKESQEEPTPADKKDGDPSDGATEDHADADQDKALFAKMIKQYLGDDHADNAEAMEMGKHAYEHHTSEGMEHEAAYEAAGKHLQTAMAIGKKMSQHEKETTESTEKNEEATEKSEEAQSLPPGLDGKKKMESKRNFERELIKANGDIAKLREDLKKYEMRDYLDKKLSESKKPVQATKKFREALGAPRSKEHIDSAYKIFMAAYEAGSEGSTDSYYAFTEKTQIKESEKSSGSYSDCLI